MLKHTREGDHLATTLIDTIADNLVRRVIGGGDIGEGTVLSSLLHTYLFYIEAVVDLEIVTHMTHIQRIETGLRLAERRIHLRHLEHLGGMIR